MSHRLTDWLINIFWVRPGKSNACNQPLGFTCCNYQRGVYLWDGPSLPVAEPIHEKIFKNSLISNPAKLDFLAYLEAFQKKTPPYLHLPDQPVSRSFLLWNLHQHTLTAWVEFPHWYSSSSFKSWRSARGIKLDVSPPTTMWRGCSGANATVAVGCWSWLLVVGCLVFVVGRGCWLLVLNRMVPVKFDPVLTLVVYFTNMGSTQKTIWKKMDILHSWKIIPICHSHFTRNPFAYAVTKGRFQNRGLTSSQIVVWRDEFSHNGDECVFFWTLKFLLGMQIMNTPLTLHIRNLFWNISITSIETKRYRNSGYRLPHKSYGNVVFPAYSHETLSSVSSTWINI